MKKTSSMDDLEFRATEALRALLGQVSVIKLKEIRRTPKGPMLARLDVLGHSHTLTCEIQPNAGPEHLRGALEGLYQDAAHYEGTTSPVLIAPYLSPEAQAVCKEFSANFLDLEGNARLALGEVFIGKRSLPARAANRSSAPAVAPPVPPPALPSALRSFPTSRLALSGRRALA